MSMLPAAQAQHAQNQINNGIPPELFNLLALQKLQADKSAAQRQLAAASGQQPTVAHSMEAEATQNARQEVAQQMGLPGILQGQQAPQVPQGQQMAQAQGLAGPKSNLPTAYAGGGIIAFDEGGQTPAPGSIEAWKRMRADAEGNPPEDVGILAALDRFLRGGSRRSGERTAEATAPAVQNTYPDESMRGSAKGIAPDAPNAAPAPVAAPNDIPQGLPAAAAAGSGIPMTARQAPDALTGALEKNLMGRFTADPKAAGLEQAALVDKYLGPGQRAKAEALQGQHQGLQAAYAAQQAQNAGHIGSQRADLEELKAQQAAHMQRRLQQDSYTPFGGALNANSRDPFGEALGRMAAREAGYRTTEAESLGARQAAGAGIRASEKAGTTANIDAQTKLNTLYNQLAEAKDAGNVTAIQAITGEIARITRDANEAAKETGTLLGVREQAAARREAAAARAQEQNNRKDDKAELQANAIRAGKEKQAMDLAMKAAVKAKADPLNMTKLRDVSEEEIASRMYPKILADLSGKAAPTGLPPAVQSVLNKYPGK
jgi:hypothetical protein